MASRTKLIGRFKIIRLKMQSDLSQVIGNMASGLLDVIVVYGVECAQILEAILIEERQKI